MQGVNPATGQMFDRCLHYGGFMLWMAEQQAPPSVVPTHSIATAESAKVLLCDVHQADQLYYAVPTEHATGTPVIGGSGQEMQRIQQNVIIGSQLFAERGYFTPIADKAVRVVQRFSSGVKRNSHCCLEY